MDGQEEKLYAVPVLITNYKDDNGEFVNQRKFFLLEHSRSFLIVTLYNKVFMYQ